MSKLTFPAILMVIITFSCQKEQLIDSFSAEVSFDITKHLPEGRHITCIERQTTAKNG